MTRKTALSFDYHCTGDVVVGDEIRFIEAVFSGSHRTPTFLGERTIEARVTKDSYGADRQQHTFTLEVLSCVGINPVARGKTIRRKGRNIYRNGTMRRVWADEAARIDAENEKHGRGDSARADRAARVEF
jgi:hypothetical protein